MKFSMATAAGLYGIASVLGCTVQNSDTASPAGSKAQPALAGLRVRFLGDTFARGETELTKLLTSEIGAAPTRIHAAAAAAVLTSADLADEDVLVLDNLARAYTEAEATLVVDWVNAGHGLMAMGGFANDSSRVAAFAASYGVSYTPDLIDSAAPGAYITDLAVPALTSGVSSLLVYGGFRLTTTNADAVAFATTPPEPVGFAITHGAGRGVIWGDDWILSDQELLRKDDDGSQPTSTFWTNALAWVGKRN